MTVSLLYNTPLWVCAKAIRKCWASENKSDTCNHINGLTDLDDRWYCDVCKKELNTFNTIITGPKDKALIERVGNKNKHKSVLEHICYSFDIDGISRACLQEWSRHRIMSQSVRSTRYTLKILKNEEPFIQLGIDNGEPFIKTTPTAFKRARKYLVEINGHISLSNIFALDSIRKRLQKNESNDTVKYDLPESFKTSLVTTINARSLQNFLELRTSPHALQEIRNLAYKIYDSLPESHKYLFTEYLYKNQ